MKPVVAAQFQGRLGNQCFAYAFARAYAEKHGYDFQCDSWLGQQIFQIDDQPITATGLTPRSENDIVEGEGNIVIRSYCQQQKCLIYTASQVREWFKFQYWVNELMQKVPEYMFEAMGHVRHGDYSGYGYPVVSIKSYLDKFNELGISEYWLCTEANPIHAEGFPSDLSFVPDFYCMTKAKTLLRGNSTFSWWAATLNQHGKIYSPVIDGLEGGKEHLCQFVDGNHKKFCNLDFITGLHLKP